MKILRKCILALAILLLVIAVLVAVIRTSLPLLARYPAVVQHQLTRALGQKVEFEQLDAQWKHWGPQITLKKVKLGTAKQALVVEQVQLGFNLLRNLKNKNTLPSYIGLTDLKLTLQQRGQGQWQVLGVPFNQNKGKTDALDSLDNIEIEISRAQVTLKRNNQQAKFIGNLQWLQTPDSFSLSGDDWKELSNKSKTPGIAFAWQRENTNDTAIQQDRISIDDLNIAPVLTWLQQWQLLPEPSHAWIKGLKPNGRLQRVKIYHQGPWDEAKTWQLRTEFKSLNTQAWNGIPGVSKINGSLSSTTKSGYVKLSARQHSWQFPSVFKTPLKLDAVKGMLQWQKTEDGWEVRTEDLQLSDAYLTVKLSGQMTVPDVDPTKAKIDLQAKLSGANIKTINPYLPGKILSKNLNHWLSTSIQDVKRANATIILRGLLYQYPFDDPKTGVFDAQVDLEDARLDYNKNWLPLEHLNIHLSFHDRDLEMTAKSAQSAKLKINNVHAKIPAMGKAGQSEVLTVSGDIRGDLAEGIAFLKKSPNQRIVESLRKQVDLSGPMQVQLNLRIPLNGESGSAKGKVEFNNGRLAVRQAPFVLQKLAGTLNFDDAKLSASHITGQWQDKPVVLEISTFKKADTDVTRVQLSSRVGVAELSKISGMALGKTITGETPYTATLDISGEGRGFQKMILRSNLIGLGVQLPPPLAKAAKSSQPAEIDVWFSQPEGVRLDIKANPRLHGKLIFQGSNKGLSFERGALTVGKQAKPAVLPAQGLNVSAYLDSVALKRWIDFWQSYTAGADLTPSILNNLTVQTDKLQMLGQEMKAATLTMHPVVAAWVVKVQSQEIAGRINFPRKKGGTIVLDLDRLYLKSAARVSKTPVLAPAEVPPLRIKVKDMRYNKHRFGQVTAELVPKARGTVFKYLTMQSKGIRLNAKGAWTGSKQKSSTQLQGQIRIHNLAQALRDWDSTPALDSRSGRVNFALSWPNAPYNFELANLKGEVALRLRKGRIIELNEETQSKIGLGKLLSILSLQTLPRRLMLDFSDLTQKGLSFDIIKGVFKLGQGNARTKDAYLDGPVARIAMRGRIGFKAKDYDMNLRVTPHVMASLPLVATIAGGPLIGAAAWVANKLVTRQMNKVAGYTYHVRGPWDKPVLKEELHPMQHIQQPKKANKAGAKK